MMELSPSIHQGFSNTDGHSWSHVTTQRSTDLRHMTTGRCRLMGADVSPVMIIVI